MCIYKRLVSALVIALLLLCGFPAYSGQQPEARTLKVGFVVNQPPYVMGETGILVELVREALQRAGYTMKIYHFPSKQFDGNPLSLFKDLDLFIGTPVTRRNDNSYFKIFEFDNVAVSLASSSLTISSVEDLEKKQIVAFNNARTHLKEPFTSFYASHLKEWQGYIEVENQRSQFAMLMKGRTQVILLDRYMVYYYARGYGVQNMDKLVFHEIFPENNEIYAVGRDNSLIRIIEENLPVMEREGWVDTMLSQYR